MHFHHNRPIFQQVCHYLCRRIVRGELQPGQKLPTVKEMADELGFNPNTIERSCQELERAGLLTPHRGHGINVTEDREKLDRLRDTMARDAVDTCLEELCALGLQEEAILELVRHRLAATR